MFRMRDFLLVSIVGLCCALTFVFHGCTTEDPLAAVSSVAMAQTPNDDDQGFDPDAHAKGKDKGKLKNKSGFGLASALCVAAMQSGLAGSMDARVLAQYCVDMALELMRADYTLE
jgi:hypothetical protein